MPYQQEKLEALLKSIAEKPTSLDMTSWVKLADGRTGTIDILHDGKDYVPPECGTTMCLGGHMANAYFAEQTAQGNSLDKEALETRFTPEVALRYVGLDVYDKEYQYYYRQFQHVFSRVRIRTIRGLKIALRQQGLL